MTKRLEERLSEALDTAARTVPDNAVPPEVFPRRASSAERRWVPVLVIGLAMAAVLIAVAIPIAISRNNSAPPASILCPPAPAVSALTYERREYTDPDYPELNKLPFGPAPKVPFTMTKDSSLNESYLEDRGVRVPIQAGQQIYSIGRVDCGWAVYRQSGKLGSQVTAEIGVLTTDGKFRSFGPVTDNGASLSPDGSQLAYVAAASRGQAEVVTVSVATGKRLAATPAGANSQVVGWNGHGVWFLLDRDKYLTKVWQPGATPITVDTDKRQLTAYRGTDRMLLSDQEAPGNAPGLCVRVATLDAANKLKTIQEKCGGMAGTLSPDGKVLVVDTNGIHGYLVDSGAPTDFNVSSMLVSVDHEAIWEDSTHLLNSAGLGTDRQVTIRCNVLTGACERIQDSPQKGVPAGPDLGYP